MGVDEVVAVNGQARSTSGRRAGLELVARLLVSEAPNTGARSTCIVGVCESCAGNAAPA
jgi:hypothetical protein